VKGNRLEAVINHLFIIAVRMPLTPTEADSLENYETEKTGNENKNMHTLNNF